MNHMLFNVYICSLSGYRLHGAIVRVIATSMVNRVFEPWPGQTRNDKIGIHCFCSSKNTTFRRKSKYWLSANQNDVSWYGEMSIHRLLFQLELYKIELNILVKYKADFIIISLKMNLLSPAYTWKVSLNNNHSLIKLYSSQVLHYLTDLLLDFFKGILADSRQ